MLMLGIDAVTLAVAKGKSIDETVVEVTSSIDAIVLLPTLIRLVAAVVNTATTVVSVDRVVVSTNVGPNVVAIVVVNGGISLVGVKGDVVFRLVIIVLMVATVVFRGGGSVGMNGNFGQGFTIGGPSMLSNT